MSFLNYSLQSMASVIIFQKSDALLGNRKKTKKERVGEVGCPGERSEGGTYKYYF